ncbi:consortin, connexin sorting protein b [Cynoglossus semilaevis]|uniref:consortin, connexin sorting protein b n=1 Tax=Cynoglossus semilaevis TaxID=244447 RepID=UPI0007DC88A1|nr:consortin-like [Cynoglossus semilaevis]
MGNKNTSSPKGPDSRLSEKEDDVFLDDPTGSASRDGAVGFSPELLASLRTLDENTDYTLLPHSLHQIAEAYSLQGDYRGAMQFLQLEKLYHERLLSNLASLQERWESHLTERNTESVTSAETESVGEKHMETLSHICRTHSRPSVTAEKSMIDVMLNIVQMKNQTSEVLPDEGDKPDASLDDGGQRQRDAIDGPVPSVTEEEEDGEAEKEMYEEGQEVEEDEPCVGTPEEEEVNVEWPAGVPQASDKDLAKLSNTEEQMKNQTSEVLPDEGDKPDASLDDGGQRQRDAIDGPVPSVTEEEEDGEAEKEMYEEGQEVEEDEPCVGTPEEEEVNVEWPAGVPQASDKDLAKLSNTEEQMMLMAGVTHIHLSQHVFIPHEAPALLNSSSRDGLVSILKRRRAFLDGLPPPSSSDAKPSCKRKVRFSEPEDAIDQDEVSGDSCLILLLLCLVTVVISIGGTALYCTLVDTYSNICTDFTQNVNFYAVNFRAFFEGLSYWLPAHT